MNDALAHDQLILPHLCPEREANSDTHEGLFIPFSKLKPRGVAEEQGLAGQMCPLQPLCSPQHPPHQLTWDPGRACHPPELVLRVAPSGTPRNIPHLSRAPCDKDVTPRYHGALGAAFFFFFN